MPVQYRRVSDVVWRRSRSGVLVRPLPGTAVVTLTGTGDELWRQLAEPLTLDELAARLAHTYYSTPGQVAQDLVPVLDDLIARGVLAPVMAA